VAGFIRNPKDFGAGLLYIAFGAVGYYIAIDYGFGRASRMGPGYFPSVLSALLMLFGLIAVIRSFITPGEPIGGFAWKATLYVTGSVVAFAVLLTPAGLIVALIAMILISAAGSHYFKFDWKAVGALIVLVAFCALVFAKGLGVPMPLLGTLFGG
jgi:hypothetical protein